MIVKSISITREGYYGYGAIDARKPLRANVEIVGVSGEIKLALNPDMSKRIVDVIADEIVAASRATAEAMTAECLNTAALPKPEAA